MKNVRIVVLVADIAIFMIKGDKNASKNISD